MCDVAHALSRSDNVLTHFCRSMALVSSQLSSVSWLQRCGWYKTTLVTQTKTDASRSVVLFILNSKPNDFKKRVKTWDTLQTDVTSLSADVTGWQDTTVEMENIILLIVVPSENNAAFLLSLSGSCIALEELVKRCSFDWSVTIGQTSGAGALAIS